MIINSGILRLFQFKKQLSCDLNALSRILVLNVITSIIVGICVLFGVHAVWKVSYLFVGLFAGFGVLGIGAMILANQPKRLVLSTFITLLVTSGLFILLAFYNPQRGYIAATFPLIALFTMGSRKGFIASIVFFLAYIAIFYFVAKATIFTVGVFTIAFTILLLMGYLFNALTSIKFSDVEKQMLEARNDARAKSEFISRLSHQIRTPLNNIMVVGDLLCNTPMDNNQKDMINTILASANNLVNVVNSLAKMTQIEVSKKIAEITFDLSSTIKNTVKLFSEQNANKVLIEYTASAPIPFIIGDPIRVKQVFLYIIEHILKISEEEKTKISITANIPKEVDHVIEISFIINCNIDINNSASGSEDDSESDNSFDKSIIQKLIEVYDGKININTTSKSSTLALTLRLNKAQQQEKQTIAGVPDSKSVVSTTTAKPAKAIDLKEANILLVEDNPINQKIAILSLNKYVKTIEVANNGKEALDKFGNSKYDLILMDIQMPIMDGITTTKKIREIESNISTHIPIIAITANALSGDKEMCLAAGMNDYISKPYQIEDLIQKMRALLS